MTIFLDKENDDDSENEYEDLQEINIAQSDVNIPNQADRDFDVLEASEAPVQKIEEIEPFNLDDLNLSVPNLKYDVDEHFIEILNEKYSAQIVEKARELCRQYDCYHEDDKIVMKMLQDGLAK